MKYIVCLLLFLVITFNVNGQQTDLDIANALLGQNYGYANAILSKMGIWYRYHYRDTKTTSGDVKPKFYSIENGDKITRVWIIKYNSDQIIDEITVNFRNDDRREVEDALKLAPLASEHHIGIYSTDIVFRWKRPK